MKCLKCNHENPVDAKFCNSCGNKLEAVCTECGKANPPGSRFCNECGCDLSKPIETAPIDVNRPSSYTPSHLADKILTNRSAIEGERKLVTVLFADVANYTSLSEKLDPEEIHQIMDGCFKILMDEIHKYEGTINQFTGDGVMALFGAPVSHEDHAQRACHAALAIKNALGDYGDIIRKDTGLIFEMRIGINSGHVIVGSIGDDLRMDYTAVGDTTNLASRMESSATPGTILLSKNTERIVREYFEIESLGILDVKGKEDPQEAFELIKTSEVDTRIKASVAKGLTRFVGRKKSMAVMMEAYEKAKMGSGQILSLVGEAGVGKSRLLLEMRNRLPENEYIYLEGQCLQYGGSMAYLPVLDILKLFFNIEDTDREFIRKKKISDRIENLDKNLISAIPPFQDLLSLSVDDEEFRNLNPKQKRERSFESLRDLLIKLSQQKPLVLVIEDLHWMDKTSEEFMDYLIGWMAKSPVLLILLYRPEYTHQWGSKSYYTKIGLDQLGKESAGELVIAMLEDSEIAPELKALILSRSAGNPLFMEEFTHTLIENGVIEKKDNKYVLNPKAKDIHVPDTVQGIIAARMDRLEDNIKRTMQVAAVIGRDFAFRILQTITGMREELKSYLLNLQGLEFIYEKNLFPELEYIFKHALTQEVAYNSLLLKRRKEIHEKIGRAIEQIYSDRLEEFYEMLAYHYTRAENLEKGHHYLKLSGDKSTKNYANKEAFEFYKRALDVLKKMPDTDENKKEQVAVCLSIIQPWLFLGFPQNSREILRRGEKLAEEIGDKKSGSIFITHLALFYSIKGDVRQGIEYCERHFKEAEKIDDIDIIASIGPDLSIGYHFYYGPLKGIEVASKVIGLIEKNRVEYEFFGKPINVYVLVQCLCGADYLFLGNFKEAQGLCEKALGFAHRIKHLPSIAFAEQYLALISFHKGDGEKTIRHAEISIKYFNEAGGSFLSAVSTTLLDGGFYLEGDFVTAQNHLKNVNQFFKDNELQYYGMISDMELGRTYLSLNEIDKAQTHIERALDIIRKNHMKVYEGSAWCLLGRILGKKKPVEFSKAEKYMLQGIKISEGMKIKPFYSQGYLYLGELYADMDKRDAAIEYLKKAEANFREMEMDYYLKKTHKVLEHL